MASSLGSIDPSQLRAVAAELGIPQEALRALVYEADPTPRHTYAGWILKQVRYGNVRLPEDAPRLLEALGTFEQAKRTRPPGIDLDINHYPRISDLEELTDRLEEISSGRKREEPRIFQTSPAPIMRQSENYAIARITDPDTCMNVAKGTKWCVRRSGPAQKYLREYGRLYLILRRTPSGELEVYGLYTPDYEQVMDTKNQPFLELDDELVSLIEPEPGDPLGAYEFAKNVIGHPWPPGEEAIATDPHASYWYAANVVEGPWPPGEEAIAKHPDLAYAYALDIIQDRWPPGERAIATNPMLAERYYFDVVKDPSFTFEGPAD